jgi:hypothetical protein
VAKGAVLEGKRLGVVMRVTHLAYALEGLSIMTGAASDGGARNPPHLAGAFIPRLLNAIPDTSRHYC